MDHVLLQHLSPRVMSWHTLGLLFILYLAFAFASAQAGTAVLTYENQTLTLDGEQRTVRVPKGYRLELLIRLESPRMLTFAANGDLFAGSKSGKVYRLPPSKKSDT